MKTQAQALHVKKSSLSSFVLLFFLMSIFSLQLFAETLPHADYFTTTTDGYTGSGIYQNSGWLIIPKQKTATKTYDFGNSNANASVKITFRVYLSSGWDRENSSKDYFKIYTNNVYVGYYSNSGNHTYTIGLNTQLDSNGKLKLDFYTDSGNDNEWSKLDYVINDNSNKPRAFTMQKQDNIRGNIVMIGNSVLQSYSGSCLNSTTQNNDINAYYADKDSDSNTYNSTSANLVLPKGIKSENIVYALLYWQGRVRYNSYASTYGRSVKLKLYGSSNYEIVTSSDEKFNYINGDYQGAIEITDKLKNSMDSLGDTVLENSGYNQSVWVADVYTNEGSNKYGAWSLIVTYKDDNDELRNITLYDGYDVVYNNSKSYTLTDFLTPTRGEVKAKFMVFAGEGDVVYKDSISLTNKNGNAISLGSDFFRSSENIDGVNITNRNPNCANTIGIDLQTVSVGTNAAIPIIENSQTQTTVTLDSGGDEYFPGVFAFATQLYEPRVCYYIDKIKDDDNVTVFEDKHFIEEIEANKNYHFDLWISNMKKNVSDTDIENAKLVQVYVQMKNGFDYLENSTQMKNIGWGNFINLTDTIGDDLGEFESDNNRSIWRVGSGATSTQGGLLEVASGFDDDSKKVFINLEGKFLVDDNTSEFDLTDFYEFRASFQTDSITIGADNAQLIEQCVDLNTSATVSKPPIGAFTVVNEKFDDTWSSIPTDQNSSINALYTQVVNKPFNVKILSLDSPGDSSISLKNFDNGAYSDDINISIISTPDYSSCGDDEDCKKSKCADNTLEKIYLGSINFGTNKIISKNITVNKAMKNASFRITFINNRGDTESACSLDSFAIRPATYSFDANETHLIGGKWYQVDANATNDSSNAKISGYTQNVDINMSLIVPSGCSLPSDSNKTTIGFTDGSSNVNIKSKDIGDYNISILDSNWTAIDQTLKTDGSMDCIQGSFSNTKDANRKVGCNVVGYKTFSFSPKKFLNTLSVSNFSTNGYTYVSNDGNMSANINITTTAILEDNSTATNYTKNCYAKDINTTVKLNTLPSGYNSIVFFDDSSTTQKDANGSDNATFSTKEGNFTSGLANLNIKFNFPRDALKATNPFKVSKNDFNITSTVDTNGTNGVDFNRSINQNTTFYYGRVHAPDYPFEGNNGTAKIYYEVYCDGCNKSDFNITGSESIDSINWYINTLHNNLNEGNNTTYNPTSPTVISTNPTKSTSITNGVENIQINTTKTPYQDKIKFNSSSWLIYNPTDFIVKFYDVGQWAGEGIKGKTIDLNISKKQNRRLDW